MAPPHKAEAKNESAVRELLWYVTSRVSVATPLLVEEKRFAWYGSHPRPLFYFASGTFALATCLLENLRVALPVDLSQAQSGTALCFREGNFKQ